MPAGTPRGHRPQGPRRASKLLRDDLPVGIGDGLESGCLRAAVHALQANAAVRPPPRDLRRNSRVVHNRHTVWTTRSVRLRRPSDVVSVEGSRSFATKPTHRKERPSRKAVRRSGSQAPRRSPHRELPASATVRSVPIEPIAPAPRVHWLPARPGTSSRGRTPWIRDRAANPRPADNLAWHRPACSVTATGELAARHSDDPPGKPTIPPDQKLAKHRPLPGQRARPRLQWPVNRIRQRSCQATSAPGNLRPQVLVPRCLRSRLLPRLGSSR